MQQKQFFNSLKQSIFYKEAEKGSICCSYFSKTAETPAFLKVSTFTPGKSPYYITVFFKRDFVKIIVKNSCSPCNVAFIDETNWRHHFKPNMVILTAEKVLSFVQ